MQSFYISFIVGLVLIFCWSVSVQAQEEYIINTKKLGIEEGMLGERVMAMHQDSDGMMWIGTLDGLNRFDGYHFKRFNQINGKLNYRDIRVRGIKEDKAGYIWYWCKNGLDFIHKKTFEVLTFEERFKNPPFEFKDIFSILNITNSNDQILIITQKKQYFLLKEDETFEHLPFFDHQKRILFEGNEIWYRTDTQLIRADISGKTLNQFSNIPLRLRPVASNTPNKRFFFHEKSKNEIVLYQFLNQKLKVLQVVQLPLESNILGLKYLPHLDKVLIIRNQKNNDKHFILDLKTNTVVPISIGISDWTIHYYDKNGLSWFSSFEGLILVDIQKQRFDIYKEAFRSRGIWANEETVLVASERNSDVFFDKKTKNKKKGMTKSLFSTLLTDKKNLWVGFKNISQINLSDNTILHSIPYSKNLGGNIWAMLRDQENSWWVGINDRGSSLGWCQPTRHDSIQLYTKYNEFEQLKNASIVHFLEDGKYIWASSNKGLLLIHKQKGVVGHYHTAAEKSFRLPFQDIHFLHQDEQGVYWAATNYDGLVRFELNNKKEVVDIQQYTSFNNLSSNVLYTIFEDKNERLWISTANGISCFNKKTKETLTFSQQDGLPNNEFNRTSGFQAADGRIYFGAFKGAVGFYPDDVLQNNTYEVNLLISSVHKYSSKKEELVDFTVETLNSQTIVQQPFERFFTIEVALTDFYHAKGLRYYYQIKGLHDDFRLMDGNRLQLSNLPYGKYKLHIKGQAADKRFSNQEIVLTLRVVRPFYLRWWFILLALAAIVLGSWKFYNYRVTQLRKQKDILEQTVQQRTEQIQQDKIIIEKQAEQLKALDKLKDQFFTNISHELRTPLTLILSPLSTLIKSKNLSNKEYTYTRIIQRHAQYLLKRINEIMELNRLEANKSQVNEEAVRFFDYIKVAISNFESIAPQKNITFLFDYQMNREIQILLDHDKYTHIIYNYLSNAFKYTPKNGQIEVILKTVQNKILLEVKDTGLGIPESAIPNVFDRFYQANNADKSSSSGIGLALCREISTLMNGRVWVESEVNQGSSFFFEMPFKEVLGVSNSEQLAIRSEELEVSPLLNLESLVTVKTENTQKVNILLVEDNPDLRAYIQSVLSEEYHVITAENGKVALKRLTENITTEQNRLPSLIISDIMMPVMDGLELLDQIKKSDELRHIPMIMLTARGSMETKLSALQLGVDDYMTKPFDEDELLVRVKNLLNNQKERLAFIQETETSDTLPLKDQKGDSEVSDVSIQISEKDQKWLQEVEKVAQVNITNRQFTKIAWAEALHISERQLRRRVKQLTGLTLTKYLQIVRLTNAREILEKGEKSTVAEVSYAVGFDTPKYFSKLFHQEYGKRPIEYLK